MASNALFENVWLITLDNHFDAFSDQITAINLNESRDTTKALVQYNVLQYAQSSVADANNIRQSTFTVLEELAFWIRPESRWRKLMLWHRA